MIRTLDRIIKWRGKPASFRCENGPEKISGALMSWAKHRGVGINYIQLGKPQQNA